ncbi:MAG: class II glutamine amidotransferase [Chromatiaceae bacterium]|nr:class II glutamine amidotransferase [Chromatiaceae bacterium]
MVGLIGVDRAKPLPELFALSSGIPSPSAFSLEPLARRDHAEEPFRDGWGAAFCERLICSLLDRPQPAKKGA